MISVVSYGFRCFHSLDNKSLLFLTVLQVFNPLTDCTFWFKRIFSWHFIFTFQVGKIIPGKSGWRLEACLSGKYEPDLMWPLQSSNCQIWLRGQGSTALTVWYITTMVIWTVKVLKSDTSLCVAEGRKCVFLVKLATACQCLLNAEGNVLSNWMTENYNVFY